LKSWTIFLVLLVGFIDYMGIGLVYPLFSSVLFDRKIDLLHMQASNALRGFYLGVLLSLMPIFQLITAPIWGRLSDQKGRKKILLLSLSISALSYLIGVFGLTYKSLVFLIFSRGLAGIGGGSISVVQASLADASTEENKAHVFGLFNMVLGFGFTIGPFLGGKLSDPGFLKFASYSLPFWFAFVVVCINAFFVAFFFQETRAIDIASAQKKTLFFASFKKAMHAQKIRLLFVCAFIFSFGWSFFFEFIPVYLIGQYRFRSPDIGNFYAYAGGLYALSCAFLIKPVVKRFTADIVFLASLLLAGCYVLLFLWVKDAAYLWIYVPALLFLIALVYPTLTAMISNWAPKQEQGETLGILQSVQSAAFALSPLFSGSLVGLYDQMPVIVGGASMLLAGTVFGSFCLYELIKNRDKNQA